MCNYVYVIKYLQIWSVEYKAKRLTQSVLSDIKQNVMILVDKETGDKMEKEEENMKKKNK